MQPSGGLHQVLIVVHQGLVRGLWGVEPAQGIGFSRALQRRNSAEHRLIAAAMEDGAHRRCFCRCPSRAHRGGRDILQWSPNSAISSRRNTTKPASFRCLGRGRSMSISLGVVPAPVIPPFLTGCSRRTYAAIFSFCAGVMPPMPMFGRSLL